MSKTHAEFILYTGPEIFYRYTDYFVGRKYPKRSHAFAKFVVLAGMLPKMLQRVAKQRGCVQLKAELVGSCFAA